MLCKIDCVAVKRYSKTCGYIFGTISSWLAPIYARGSSHTSTQHSIMCVDTILTAKNSLCKIYEFKVCSNRLRYSLKVFNTFR